MLKLKLINEDNFSYCIKIKTSVENNDYVDDVVYSIAKPIYIKMRANALLYSRMDK